MVLALLVAAPLIDYPICAGRLTLFTLFALQLVLLEGVSWIGMAALSSSEGGSVIAALLIAGFGASLVPSAVANFRRRLPGPPPPGDLRLLKESLDKHPGFSGDRRTPAASIPCSRCRRGSESAT